MLYAIKQAIPLWMKAPYHWVMAWLSAILYRFPSRNIIVIGVTGTNGKSSTVQFIAQMLEHLGQRVGYTGTAGFSIAGTPIENRLKMTMPGRFFLQKMFRKMVQQDCRYAIIETTSQGIVQFRHTAINYDVTVFTNLTPEHIEAHGGFENYKQAKGRLFSHLTRRPHKVIGNERIEKISVINADDPHAPFFLSFPADETVRFSWHKELVQDPDVLVEYEKYDQQGAHVSINGTSAVIPLHATFEQKNAIAAFTTVRSLGFGFRECLDALAHLSPLPGRFELIQMGQPFTVIVDYAYEPYAIEALLNAVDQMRDGGRIIGIHGSAGGGRDVSRREKIGRLAGQREDIVIVTNEDPYDEDPRVIIEAVADGARAAGKVEGEDLFLCDDRMDAIRKAIEKAQEGDVVVVAGKGSETVMAVAGGKKESWSDREAVRLALKESMAKTDAYGKK